MKASRWAPVVLLLFCRIREMSGRRCSSRPRPSSNARTLLPPHLPELCWELNKKLFTHGFIGGCVFHAHRRLHALMVARGFLKRQGQPKTSLSDPPDRAAQGLACHMSGDLLATPRHFGTQPELSTADDASMISDRCLDRACALAVGGVGVILDRRRIIFHVP